MEKHPAESSKPFAKVEEAVWEVALNVSASSPPASVEVAVVVPMYAGASIHDPTLSSVVKSFSIVEVAVDVAKYALAFRVPDVKSLALFTKYTSSISVSVRQLVQLTPTTWSAPAETDIVASPWKSVIASPLMVKVSPSSSVSPPFKVVSPVMVSAD